MGTRRSGWLAAVAAVAALSAAMAGLPATPLTFTVSYPANQTLAYNVHVTSQIVIDASGHSENLMLSNDSTVLLQTGAGSASGMNLELTFGRYQTQVLGSGTVADELKRGSAKNDAAAQQGARLLVHLKPDGQAEILSRPPAGMLDQEMSMLEQFARADVFPPHPVAVGARWTRQRNEDVPNLRLSVPLVLDCFLASVSGSGSRATALIDINTHGSVNFAGANPGSFELNGTTQNQYFVSTGVLAHSDGHTVNTVRFTGSGGSTTRIDSHGAVQLRTPPVPGS